MIYFDNAASSHPKPAEVVDAVRRALEEFPANPGRSAHEMSVRAARAVSTARRKAADFLGSSEPSRVSFTKSATEAINVVLCGFLRPGDGCIVSAFEHNAVMRPLRHLQGEHGVKVIVAPPGKDSPIDIEFVAREAESAKMLVVTLCSNVTGEIFPVAELAEICARGGVFFLLDAAQGLGALRVNTKDLHIDALAATGHKGLLGPQGAGFFYLRNPESIDPFLRGGTGSRSESEEQPSFPPDRFEAGTLPTPAICGLAAGIDAVLARGVFSIREDERNLCARLLERLGAIPGIILYGPRNPERMLPVVSFNVKGLAPDELARGLFSRGVACRVGLHCSPAAHRALGTYPAGTVRFSLGPSNTTDEMDEAVSVVAELAKGRSSGTTG